MTRTRSVLFGLIAMFGMASSAGAANIALFSDPVYTDETIGAELEQLSNAMQGLGHTVVPFSGILGVNWTTALAAADVVVLPENEGLSIADSLSQDARKALVGFLLAGNGALFHGDSPRRTANLMNQLFGFVLTGTSNTTIATPLIPAGAAGTAFEGGPATVPPASAVWHVDTTTLPPGSRAIYGDAALTTVFTTTVGGTGRVAYLGFDWFTTPSPTEWVQVLGRAITHVDAASAQSFQIAYFRDGNYVDLIPSSPGEAEGLNLEETLNLMGHALTPFVGLTAANWQAALADADAVVISEQEEGSLAADMPADTRAVLAAYVLGGGTLLVTDSGFQTTTLFNDLFGLTSAGGGYGSLPLVGATAAGTAFAAGPANLPHPSATQELNPASFPARLRSYYGDANGTGVLTMPQGFGTVSYLGWDWFGSFPSFPWWGALSSALIESDRAPAVVTFSPASAPGADAAVTVDLSGFGGLATAVLRFRKGGDAAFQSAPLVQGGPTSWSATVPAAFVTAAGIQGFLELKDAATTAIFPAAAPDGGRFVNIPVNLANHQIASLPGGSYQLRGVPMQAANANPVNVFDELGAYNTKNWRYGTFNGTTYLEPDAAAAAIPGQGFWIISKDAKNIATSGTSTNLAGPVTITLRQGFNQIANPFSFPVDFADVVRPAEVENNLIGFNGSYVNGVATLEVGQGYWIKNNGPGNRDISIPALGAGVAAAPRPVVALSEGSDWAIRVDAHAGRFADTGNLFGAREGASEGRDVFDLSEPPPAPEGWVRAGFASSEDGELFCDWRPAGTSGATWQVTFASDQAGKEFSLALTPEGALPEGWGIVAFEGAREVELGNDLRITGRVGSTTAPRTFTVSAGSASFLGQVRAEAEAAVTTFQLAAPFPNPASAGVTIDLALPNAVDRATVEVFDVQGRRVRTLVDGALERGIQRIAWDGRSGNGQRATAGVYFMKARAADFTATRKVVLLP